MIEAGIGQVQAQQGFPIQTRANRIGSLAVGHGLHELEQDHQRETSWRCGRLPLDGKKIGEVAAGKEHPEFVIHAHHEIAFGKDGMGNTCRLFRYQIGDLRSERHRCLRDGRDQSGDRPV